MNTTASPDPATATVIIPAEPVHYAGSFADATGKLRVVDSNGDSTITWTPGNADQERAAREHVELLRGQGYRARGEFDPAAGEIVMAPPAP